MFQSVPLQGVRAELIPFASAHAEGLFAASADPAIWAYMPAKRPRSVAEMQAVIEAALVEQTRGVALPFTIWDRETQAIVGSTRLMDIVPAHRQAEIGWTWLAPAARRTRINTECKYLLLRHCFETLGFIRVQLKADARNERSLRAIERIGGVREGVLRRHRILPDGFVRDSVYYSILAEEWPTMKTRLEGMLGAVPR